MSTRGVFTFSGDGEEYHVYVHHDCYPEGAAAHLSKALESNMVWQLPRFEASEFAAGFVAATKTQPGGVTLMVDRDDYSDTQYCYMVYFNKNINALGLEVRAINLTDEHDSLLWEGPLKEFIEMGGDL